MMHDRALLVDQDERIAGRFAAARDSIAAKRMKVERNLMVG